MVKHSELLEDTVCVLKTSFHLLRGYEKAPEDLIKRFRALRRKLQGIEHVSWDEAVPEPAVTLNTTVVLSTEEPEERPTLKRKLEEEEDGEKTFVMTPSKNKMTGGHLLAKGGVLHGYVSAIAVEMLSGVLIVFRMLRSDK